AELLEVNAHAAAGVVGAQTANGRSLGGEPIVLKAFPKGSKPGDFFHKVFELVDFSIDEAQLQQVVREQFAAFSIASPDNTERYEALNSMATRAILATLSTPLLADASLRLTDIPLSERFSEFSFQLPVQNGLNALKLASVFSAQYASPELPAGYAKAVAALPFKELLGYLNGVIDLIFQHEGKWYLVDYKSNYLGDFSSDYDLPQMTEKMAEAHYFLQYHLYTLGLHRYLQVWQPGYNYAEHFGGVLYLFIKGMQASAEIRTGIFFEKPPQARIEALSALFGAGAAP
ncbi:MAG TPA: PD-(D/E)XK nuclease family protein, partial [Polyangiaceae bacterium]|nr:PD-(D/E)XK nuclease family protein [Polyangiaceae bacterium]